jgi:hypothetical protein
VYSPDTHVFADARKDDKDDPGVRAVFPAAGRRATDLHPSVIAIGVLHPFTDGAAHGRG